MRKKSKKRLKILFFLILGTFCIFFVGWLLTHSSQRVVSMNKIAVISIKGTLSTENGGDFFKPGTLSSGSIIEFIEDAHKNTNVKAIILNINSPGGSVVASKEIADTIKKVDKPVVALIREIGASGAYWIASAADIIVADPLSLTGSIGVLGSYLEFSELFSKYGVEYQSISTGKFKDLGSPFKNLTMDEKKVLLGKLHIIHDYFSEDVSKNRDKDLRMYANGLFYLGTEAKEIGLIDVLGGKDTAIDIALDLANITDYELFFYQKKKSIFELFSSLSHNFGYSIGQGFGERLLAQNDFEISLK